MIKDEPKIDNAQANDAIDIDANASMSVDVYSCLCRSERECDMTG